jgi:hypothetical protein
MPPSPHPPSPRPNQGGGWSNRLACFLKGQVDILGLAHLLPTPSWIFLLVHLQKFFRFKMWRSEAKSNRGIFWILFCFMYCIQHCFICRPSDSTVSEDAGIESRTVATSTLAVRRSITTRLDIIH